jgi:hypothetical protein
MILPLRRWEEIRQWFDEDERADLNKAITGEAICPKGAIIDREQLEPALREKLDLHLGRTMRAGASS